MKKKYLNRLLTGIKIISAVLFIHFAGCKAPPGKVSDFTRDTTAMTRVGEIEAYHRAWAKKDVDWNKFKKIYVAPVSTKYLQERNNWQKSSFAELDPKGVEDIAEFTRQTFISAHRANRSPHRLEVVDAPDASSLILEMAITELLPTKVWLNSIGAAAIIWAPDKGLIAIEARLRDGVNGPIIAVFSDREQGKESLFNVKDYTWYSHAQSIIKEWAQQSVEITNADEGAVISDSPSFEIKAW